LRYEVTAHQNIICGDDKVVLRNCEKDALLSTANFLNKLGWEPELRRGLEVVLLAGFNDAGLSNKRKILATGQI
jgi:membrane-bound lytic murein transglycosylase B